MIHRTTRKCQKGERAEERERKRGERKKERKKEKERKVIGKIVEEARESEKQRQQNNHSRNHNRTFFLSFVAQISIFAKHTYNARTVYPIEFSCAATLLRLFLFACPRVFFLAPLWSLFIIYIFSFFYDFYENAKLLLQKERKKKERRAHDWWCAFVSDHDARCFVWYATIALRSDDEKRSHRPSIMFSRSQSKKQAENDLIGANRLLTQLRELNLVITSSKSRKKTWAGAQKADSLQEVADKHAKDLLESRMKIEEQTKTIEQLANAVKREKSWTRINACWLARRGVESGGEERERKRGTFEREGERDEDNGRGYKRKDGGEIQKGTGRDEGNGWSRVEAPTRKIRVKWRRYPESTEEEDETKRREREEEEEEKGRDDDWIEKGNRAVEGKLEKKPEEQPVIIEGGGTPPLLLLLPRTTNSNSCAERAKNKAKLFNDWNEKLDP